MLNKNELNAVKFIFEMTQITSCHLKYHRAIINLVLMRWLLGQAVKTPPFHGGNTGSSPVGVTIFLGLVV